MTIDTVGDMKQGEYNMKACKIAVHIAIEHLNAAKKCLRNASRDCDNYTDGCWFDEVLASDLDDKCKDLEKWLRRVKG